MTCLTRLFASRPPESLTLSPSWTVSKAARSWASVLMPDQEMKEEIRSFHTWWHEKDIYLKQGPLGSKAYSYLASVGQRFNWFDQRIAFASSNQQVGLALVSYPPLTGFILHLLMLHQICQNTAYLLLGIRVQFYPLVQGDCTIHLW